MAEESQAEFRLRGGEICLVAGHRVLHTREAPEPTGHHHLQDAYYQHDSIFNHLTVFVGRQRR